MITPIIGSLTLVMYPPYSSIILWPSIFTQQNVPSCSVMFFHLLSRSPFKYIRPHTCTSSLLLICAIHMLYLPHLESPAPRPNLPLPLVHLIILELLFLIRCRGNSERMNQWGRTLTWCLILLQADWGSYHLIVGVESLVFQVIRTQLIYIQSIVCTSGWNYQ